MLLFSTFLLDIRFLEFKIWKSLHSSCCINITFVQTEAFCGLIFSKNSNFTIFYVAGYFVQQHQSSMKVIDVLLSWELKRHFEDTVVFPCPEFKHKLLLSSTSCFAFVFLHGHSWKTEANSKTWLRLIESSILRRNRGCNGLILSKDQHKYEKSEAFHSTRSPHMLADTFLKCFSWANINMFTAASCHIQPHTLAPR